MRFMINPLTNSSHLMHAHWKSCNYSTLWSMQSKKLILADVIVVTTAATVQKHTCDAYFWLGQSIKINSSNSTSA